MSAQLARPVTPPIGDARNGEALGVRIIVRELDGAIRYWASGRQTLYGFTAAEAIGRDVHALLHTEFSSPRGEVERELLASGAWVGEIAITDKASLRHAIAAQWSLRQGADETPIVCEIHEEAQALRTVEERQAALFDSVRSSTISSLASWLAQELNQPLSAMRNYIATLERALDKSAVDFPGIRDLIGKVSQQARRSSDIVQGLRAMIARNPPKRSEVTVQRLVEDGLILAANATRRFAVRTSVTVAPDMPSVNVDAMQIGQVIANMVSNAATALESSRQRVIEVSVFRSADGGVQIDIRDSGPGVTRTLSDRYFYPTGNENIETLGIGLFATRQTIEAHGGRLWTTPSSAGGSVVSFTLPASRGR